MERCMTLLLIHPTNYIYLCGLRVIPKFGTGKTDFSGAKKLEMV